MIALESSTDCLESVAQSLSGAAYGWSGIFKKLSEVEL